MATIYLRNLPEATYVRLKADALRNRRSLNQEIIVQLAESVGYDLTADDFARMGERNATSPAPLGAAASVGLQGEDRVADGTP